MYFVLPPWMPNSIRQCKMWVEIMYERFRSWIEPDVVPYSVTLLTEKGFVYSPAFFNNPNDGSSASSVPITRYIGFIIYLVSLPYFTSPQRLVGAGFRCCFLAGNVPLPKRFMLQLFRMFVFSSSVCLSCVPTAPPPSVRWLYVVLSC